MTQVHEKERELHREFEETVERLGTAIRLGEKIRVAWAAERARCVVD